MTSRTMVIATFVAREAFRDRAMWCALVMLVASLLLAFGSGEAWLRDQRAALTDLRQAATAHMAGLRAQGDSILAGKRERPRGYWNDPSDVRGFGYYQLRTYSVRPPAPLGMLTVGMTKVQPSVFQVGPGSTTSFAASYDIDNPDRLALDRIDVTFIIIVFLPLLIAAVGHGALSTDGEAGRLPLLALHGVSAKRIAVLRLVIRCAVLAIAAVITVVLSVVITPDWDGRSIDLGVWLFIATAYGACWMAITLVVVSLTRQSATAAAALGVLWIAIVLVLPWCISLVAARAYSMPSRIDQVLAARAATDEASTARGALLSRYLVDHPEFGLDENEAASDSFTAQQILTARLVDARQVASDTIFDRRIESRERLVRRLAWLSPAVLAQQAMMDVAGTGSARQRAFMEQTRSYVDELRRFFEPRALRSDRRFNEWDGWPRFEWQEPSSDDRLTTGAQAGLGLLVIAAIMILLALLVFPPLSVQRVTR